MCRSGGSLQKKKKHELKEHYVVFGEVVAVLRRTFPTLLNHKKSVINLRKPAGETSNEMSRSEKGSLI